MRKLLSHNDIEVMAPGTLISFSRSGREPQLGIFTRFEEGKVWALWNGRRISTYVNFENATLHQYDTVQEFKLYSKWSKLNRKPGDIRVGDCIKTVDDDIWIVVPIGNLTYMDEITLDHAKEKYTDNLIAGIFPAKSYVDLK